ncbi:Mau2 Chromatid Cohesion Factor-like [Manis pentadactyla]|nr:Mau2 Chromatid Cohesion Factor-like [Manis pentadactyla]
MVFFGAAGHICSFPKSSLVTWGGMCAGSPGICDSPYPSAVRVPEGPAVCLTSHICRRCQRRIAAAFIVIILSLQDE